MLHPGYRRNDDIIATVSSPQCHCVNPSSHRICLTQQYLLIIRQCLCVTSGCILMVWQCLCMTSLGCYMILQYNSMVQQCLCRTWLCLFVTDSISLSLIVTLCDVTELEYDITVSVCDFSELLYDVTTSPRYHCICLYSAVFMTSLCFITPPYVCVSTTTMGRFMTAPCNSMTSPRFSLSMTWNPMWL